MAISPDGKLAISASRDNTLKVWEIQSGTTIAEFSADYDLNCVAFAPDGAMMIAGDSQGNLHWLELAGL